MEEKARAIFCVLFGHSRIQTSCLGYWYCGRCGQQLGDTLASVYTIGDLVNLNHSNCLTCEHNRKHLTWKDKFLIPNRKETQ